MHKFSTFIQLLWAHKFILSLGIVIAVLTLLANMGLMAVSAWFITTAAIAATSIVTAQAYNAFSFNASVRGFAFTRMLGKYLERIVTHEGTFRVLADIRVYFYQLIAPRLPSKNVKFQQADLYNRIMTDVEALDHLYLRLIVPLCVLFAGVLAVAGLIVYCDAYLLFYALLILTWGVMLIAWVAYKCNVGVGQSLVEQSKTVRGHIFNVMSGFRDISIYQVQPFFNDALKQEMKQYHQNVNYLQAMSAKFIAITQGLVLLTLCITVYIAVNLNYTKELPISWVVVFAFVMIALTEALLPLPVAFQFLGKLKRSLKRVFELQSLPLDRAPTQAVYTKLDSPLIQLDGVSFTFGTKRVLDNVSLTIHAGSKIALVGTSGEGKSTLLNLIARLWAVDEGVLSVAGHDVNMIKESSLNDYISFASQRVHIFADTLRDNLVIANTSATDEMCVAALEHVQLTYLLEQGAGLEQWIGDGGRALSGGEQRRIEIARLLLRNAPIVLLDEVTEGLDKTTEKQINSVLHHYLEGKTVVQVSHRLTGLEKYDAIYRLCEGHLTPY